MQRSLSAATGRCTGAFWRTAVTAFKRLKNFATVVLQRNRLLLYLHLDPVSAIASLPNARDVSAIGHWGTGDLEIALSTPAELDAVKPLIAAAYEGRTGKPAEV